MRSNLPAGSERESGGIRAGVPFSPGLVWRREPDGGVWGALTGNYTLFRLGPDGDTLRVVTREFEPLPVTAEDVERAMESLAWFTEQGGRVDGSRFPDMKPALATFFLDDAGRLWVLRTADGPEARRILDVFEEGSRYLGPVRLPFPLSPFPTPVVRGDRLLAVTADEVDVQYVVVARILR